MFTQNFRIASLITLSLLSLSSAAFAEDMRNQSAATQTTHTQHFGSTEATNTRQAAPSSLDLFQKDYMRETYQDVQITLFGPVKLGVSEDIIQHRFSNIDVNYGPRVQSPNFAGQFDNSTYLRATAATTSIKFKF